MRYLLGPMPIFELTARRALVLAPHADDEVLGAGGLLARLSALGWETHVLYATISGYPSVALGEVSHTEARVAEVEAALEVLGVTGYEALFVGDDKHLRLDSVPQAELIGAVEAALGRVEPYLVVVPCFGHYHQDHRAVAQACIAALRPAPGARLPFVPAVLAYGHGASGWGGVPYEFRPTVFADISDVIELKMAAMACYASQLCTPPHLRSLEKIRRWSASWGNYAGVAHAEPFECLRLAL
jgi:N-acetylglucosamine malate deacetylase 1